MEHIYKHYISAIFIGLALLSVLFSCSTARSTQQLQLNDKIIEYDLQGLGSPTIVFETGMGQTIETWNPILDSLSKHTQVYAYNRQGYGKSNLINSPRDIVEVVRQLKSNLVEQNISSPYILVGHSIGGLYINMFARLYPEDVAGVVFIDSSHPEQFEYFKEEHSLLYDILITSTKKSNRKYEYDIVTTALKSFANVPEFPDIPITVLTAGKKSSPLESKKLREKWLQFQNDLAGLSAISKQLIVDDSGHYIHRRNPDITISEILRIITICNKK